MQPGGELGSTVSPFGWFPPPLRPPLFCPPPPWEHGFWAPPDGYAPPPAWYPPAYQEPLRRPHGGERGGEGATFFSPLPFFSLLEPLPVPFPDPLAPT